MTDKKRDWLNIVIEIAALKSYERSGMLKSRADIPETIERLKVELKETLNKEDP